MGVVAEAYGGVGEDDGSMHGTLGLKGPAVCPEAGVGEAKWGGPFDSYVVGTARAYRAEKVERDDVVSIESIGDNMLSAPVKDVVHATPRGASAMHNVEQKVNTPSGDEVRTIASTLHRRHCLWHGFQTLGVSSRICVGLSLTLPATWSCRATCSVWMTYLSTASW